MYLGNAQMSTTVETVTASVKWQITIQATDNPGPIANGDPISFSYYGITAEGVQINLGTDTLTIQNEQSNNNPAIFVATDSPNPYILENTMFATVGVSISTAGFPDTIFTEKPNGYLLTSYSGNLSNSTANLQAVVAFHTDVQDAAAQPPLTVPQSFSVNYGQTIDIPASQLLTGDTDPQNEVLHISAVSGAGAFLSPDGTIIRYIAPKDPVAGNVTSFIATVTDTAGLTTNEGVTVQLLGGPAPPIVQDESLTATIGQPSTYTVAQLTADDTDPQGGTLSISAVSGIGAVLNSDGTVTYNPPISSAAGTASFSFIVKDTAGLTSKATAHIVLQSPAQPPVVQNENLSALYGTTTMLTAAQLTAGDSDPQNGTLSISAVSGNNVKLNSDGTVAFTGPNSPVTGNSTSFDFTVKDTAGLTANATANVSLANPPPPTVNQLQIVGNDMLQFYHDQKSHKSTAADLTKLKTDVKALNPNQYSLGQLLGTALVEDAGSNANTLGFALSAKFYPTISGDLASNSGNLPNDLSNLLVTAVAVGNTYASLIKHESASLALSQTESQYKIS
jgi:hypothetical protein